MRILVVGNGGREHALAWKLSRDSARPEIFCAPGNAGTALVGTNLPIAGTDLEAVKAWALEHRPDLTVIGPEAPLCAGLADVLEAEGFRVFGPGQEAAQLEGSKVFAKDVMQAAGVPTAKAASFSDLAEALAYVRELGAPLVVKADGLAAGKGVILCETVEEAEAAVRESMEHKRFGPAGEQVLIEEFLQGEEASILALVDGEHVVMLASSQDHKRAYNDDQGPNTGGMGAYSPAPVVTDDLWPVIREQVFDRTLAELKKRGICYKGVLYAGLMISDAGPNVLEFNCRFGDPETQAVLMRWKNDMVPALEACVDGTLNDSMIEWTNEPSVCVVMASGGYPGSYEKGRKITGLDACENIDQLTVFHAGTQLDGENVTTAGGRVLGVTALGNPLENAIDRAYQGVHAIHFEDAHFRTDIGAKAMRRNG